MTLQRMAPVLFILVLTGTTCEQRSITLSPLLSLLPTNGDTCDTSGLSDDLAAGFTIDTTHPLNQKDHGCLIVSSDDGFPVLAGSQSFRFEVQPGDCSGNDGFDDCANDRSRHEIQERDGISNGETTQYELNLFIPGQPNFKPRGANLLFLGQLTVSDQGFFTTLIYLEIDDNHNLLLRTHQDFSFDVDQQIVLASDIFDRWIHIRYEVHPAPDSTGYVRVHVDDEMLYSESRPTIPSDSGELTFRVGIYNAFVSEAAEDFDNQVMFVDELRKY